MPPTTATVICICQSRQIRRSAAKSGSLPSIKWSHLIRAPRSQDTSASGTMIFLIIGETRKYIRDFERLAMQTKTARELYDEMIKLDPDWINRGALWSSVRAIRT